MNKKIYIISILIVFLDQITKNIIEVIFKLNESFVVIKNFFYLSYTNNYGAAWSILSNKTWFFILIGFIALVFFFRLSYSFKSNNRNVIAFSLILGGILGNLLDRIFLGYVRDFFHFYIFDYSFPIFNIADICVVCGTILIIFAILKGEDKKDEHNS